MRYTFHYFQLLGLYRVCLSIVNSMSNPSIKGPDFRDSNTLYVSGLLGTTEEKEISRKVLEREDSILSPLLEAGSLGEKSILDELREILKFVSRPHEDISNLPESDIKQLQYALIGYQTYSGVLIRALDSPSVKLTKDVAINYMHGLKGPEDLLEGNTEVLKSILNLWEQELKSITEDYEVHGEAQRCLNNY